MCRIFITSDLILVNDLGCSLFSKEKMVNLLDFKEAQREEKKTIQNNCTLGHCDGYSNWSTKAMTIK